MENEMDYPSDETDLTSDQMDQLMAGGETVELVEPSRQILLPGGTNGVVVTAQTWGSVIRQQSHGVEVRVEQPA
jgi:hypothetical protein